MNIGPLSKTNFHLLHSDLWAFRRDVEAHWPTPNTLDALRFAVCESCESLDQYLRLNATYKRNRAVDPTADELYNELADTAMMLFTAIGPNVQSWYFDDLGVPTIDAIVVNTAKALEMATGKLTGGKMFMITRVALGVIALIDAYPGMDLPARLSGRLARIRAKHCQPAAEVADA